MSARNARNFLELIKSWADAGGMTLEQAADFLDNVAEKTQAFNKASSTDAPSALATMTPAKGKH